MWPFLGWDGRCVSLELADKVLTLIDHVRVTDLADWREEWILSRFRPVNSYGKSVSRFRSHECIPWCTVMGHPLYHGLGLLFHFLPCFTFCELVADGHQ